MLYDSNFVEDDVVSLEEKAYYLEKDTRAIKTQVMPLVDKALESTKEKNAYKKNLNDFISKRDQDLYDSLPCSRIICNEEEMDKLFTILNIDKTKVTSAIYDTYYGKESNFSPKSAKHEFTVTQMCVIRHYVMQKMQKEAEISMLYLAFSGKFYPSLHYRSYPNIVPVRYVMEYVVNNKLSQKYDLTAYGSIFGAIKSVGTTWIETYKDKFKTFEDEDVVYLIQQLYSRIGSFMKNIAEEYYKAYENKDIYMAYSSDSYEQGDYHLANNDILKVDKITENVIGSITSTGIDYKLAKACSDENISPNEVKAVIESIVSDKGNILTMKELVSLMLTTYFAADKDKDVTDITFITYSVSPKPNAKQKEIIRQKEIIENWLSDSGTAYLRRRSRIATRNSYERAVRMYFALVIHNVARKA